MVSIRQFSALAALFGCFILGCGEAPVKIQEPEPIRSSNVAHTIDGKQSVESQNAISEMTNLESRFGYKERLLKGGIEMYCADKGLNFDKELKNLDIVTIRMLEAGGYLSTTDKVSYKPDTSKSINSERGTSASPGTNNCIKSDDADLKSEPRITLYKKEDFEMAVRLYSEDEKLELRDILRNQDDEFIRTLEKKGYLREQQVLPKTERIPFELRNLVQRAGKKCEIQSQGWEIQHWLGNDMYSTTDGLGVRFKYIVSGTIKGTAIRIRPELIRDYREKYDKIILENDDDRPELAIFPAQKKGKCIVYLMADNDFMKRVPKLYWLRSVNGNKSDWTETDMKGFGDKFFHTSLDLGFALDYKESAGYLFLSPNKSKEGSMHLKFKPPGDCTHYLELAKMVTQGSFTGDLELLSSLFEMRPIIRSEHPNVSDELLKASRDSNYSFSEKENGLCSMLYKKGLKVVGGGEIQTYRENGNIKIKKWNEMPEFKPTPLKRLFLDRFF